jgi:hypothetical protein
VTSKVFDHTKASILSKSYPPTSGCTDRSQVLTPIPIANCRSNACFALTKRKKLKDPSHNIFGWKEIIVK